MGNSLTNELQIIKQLINKVDDYKMGLQCALSRCCSAALPSPFVVYNNYSSNSSLFIARYCCALFISHSIHFDCE